MAEKKLFLLDAFALIYRAYFAFSKNPRVSSQGLNTSAVFGFTNTLLDVLKNQNPTHLAVVFDTPEPTERHIEFTEYKANREAMPEDIAVAIPYVFKLLEAMNIPAIGKPGFEADDVVGTLARMAEERGFTTYMMTPDKDYAQLVTEKTFMYKPARTGNAAEVWGIEEVKEKFEVTDTSQVIDYLGMMGDKVDNIPGIPGVGDKRAKELIKAYGSMEGLYENTHELKGKLKENVENNKEQAFLSKKLATIIIDVPVEFNEKELEVCEPNEEAVKALFEELEFKNMLKRVLPNVLQEGEQASLFGDGDAVLDSPGFKTIESTEHDYLLVDSPALEKQVLEEWKKADAFCFDTETTALNVFEAEILGLALCFQKGKAYYWSMDESNAKSVLEQFQPFFEDAGKVKIAHNLKYDMAILANYGVKVEHQLFDTMLAHYIINPDGKHGMDALSETYLNYQPVSIETLIGKKGKSQMSMKQVPLEKVAPYAAEDADITFQLYEVFKKELETTESLPLFNDIEVPLVQVLHDMEHEGINLDEEALKQLSESLNNDLIALVESIYKHAGHEFSINSPKQLGVVLFEELQISDKPKKTKTGQYATGEDVLTKLEEAHPIVREILEYRQMTKLKSTYVDALPTLVNPETHHIHTSYNQAVAATGRLSSNNPNLQNIPIRSERGREVRKAFIPRSEDFVLMAADYSQVELRIIAALAKDENMIADFVAKKDIHTATAARVFGVSTEEVDRDLRSRAKAVNFGIIYGQSAFGLSQQLGIKRGEAKEIIDNYFEKYASIKSYMDTQVELARERGYVETIMGRKRHLADINSRNATVRGFAERNAINAPIQGSAADVIKVAMIKIHEWMKTQDLKSKMLLQVHDELVFDVHKDELEIIKPKIVDLMEHAVEFEVPLEVETGIGKNWLEAH